MNTFCTYIYRVVIDKKSPLPLSSPVACEIIYHISLHSPSCAFKRDISTATADLWVLKIFTTRLRQKAGESKDRPKKWERKIESTRLASSFNYSTPERCWAVAEGKGGEESSDLPLPTIAILLVTSPRSPRVGRRRAAGSIDPTRLTPR